MSKKIIFLIETHGTGFRNVTINPKKKILHPLKSLEWNFTNIAKNSIQRETKFEWYFIQNNIRNTTGTLYCLS